MGDIRTGGSAVIGFGTVSRRGRDGRRGAGRSRDYELVPEEMHPRPVMAVGRNGCQSHPHSHQVITLSGENRIHVGSGDE
jgi:hypothetical protein